jgi:hypothetical protein
MAYAWACGADWVLAVSALVDYKVDLASGTVGGPPMGSLNVMGDFDTW